MKPQPFVAAMLAATLAVPALAAAPAYQCSGIGSEEREAAEQVPHTLRLVFAEPGGAYLGGVATQVASADGTTLVEVTCPGPWLLLNLPDGSYKVTASLNGKTVSRSVTVAGGKRQEQTFVF